MHTTSLVPYNSIEIHTQTQRVTSAHPRRRTARRSPRPVAVQLKVVVVGSSSHVRPLLTRPSAREPEPRAAHQGARTRWRWRLAEGALRGRLARDAAPLPPQVGRDPLGRQLGGSVAAGLGQPPRARRRTLVSSAKGMPSRVRRASIRRGHLLLTLLVHGIVSLLHRLQPRVSRSATNCSYSPMARGRASRPRRCEVAPRPSSSTARCASRPHCAASGGRGAQGGHLVPLKLAAEDCRRVAKVLRGLVLVGQRRELAALKPLSEGGARLDLQVIDRGVVRAARGSGLERVAPKSRVWDGRPPVGPSSSSAVHWTATRTSSSRRMACSASATP